MSRRWELPTVSSFLNRHDYSLAIVALKKSMQQLDYPLAALQPLTTEHLDRPAPHPRGRRFIRPECFWIH